MRYAISRLLPALALLLLWQLPAVAQVIGVEPISFDFGDMNQQETRTTKVTVTNNGAGLLNIDDVKADCGCTVPTLVKDSLAPGESTEIEIQFNSQKFHGNVIKAVKISSNDPTTPVFEVMIRANVHAALLVDPPHQRVGFTRSMLGETASREITFTATEIDELVISAEKSRKGLFKVQVRNAVDGDPRKAAIDVILAEDSQTGRLRDHVRVTTNVPEMPTVDIEVQAWVSQELTCAPEQLSFRYKKSFKQYLRVAPYRQGIEFKITGAEIDLPEINLEVIETIPNGETKILVEGTPIDSSDPRAQANNGRIKGTLIIHTNLTSTPIIEVPVTYMVRL